LRNIDAGVLALVHSDSIRLEYLRAIEDRRVRALFERHGVPLSDVREVIEELCRMSRTITVSGEPPAFRDEKDRQYLHCVAASGADFLVTFDRALLEERSHASATIVTPDQLLRQLPARGTAVVD
jgi:predicted nucleic acid-binding protein